MTAIFAIAPFLTVNLFALALPLLGGTLGPMRWGHVIYALILLPLIAALGKLTDPPPDHLPIRAERPLMFIIMSCTILLVVYALLYALMGLYLGRPLRSKAFCGLTANLIDLMVVVAGCYYVYALCRALGLRELGKQICCWGILLFAAWFLEKLADSYLERLSWASTFSLLLYGFVHVAAFWRLFHLSRHIAYIEGGRCGRCGYSLVAITEPRCPECGWWADGLYE